MSDIQPKGVPVEIYGEERHLLFDYAVIAEIQDSYDSDVLSALRQIFMDDASSGEYRARVLTDILHKLLLDEYERERILNGKELKVYTKKQVGFYITRKNADDYVGAILKAWGISIPDPEDTDPNATRGTEI